MAPVQFLFTRSLTPFEKSILIEIIPWILGLLYFPKGIYISLKGADLNKFLTLGVIFIFMLTFTLLYSTVNCNLGTLYRFKGILLPFFYLLKFIFNLSLTNLYNICEIINKKEKIYIG